MAPARHALTPRRTIVYQALSKRSINTQVRTTSRSYSRWCWPCWKKEVRTPQRRGEKGDLPMVGQYKVMVEKLLQTEK